MIPYPETLNKYNLEKLIAFMLLAYAVGLLIGETIRDEVYRGKKAPGLLGAFYPPQAPAPAEAQAIFEAHPAGPEPVQGQPDEPQKWPEPQPEPTLEEDKKPRVGLVLFSPIDLISDRLPDPQAHRISQKQSTFPGFLIS
jgi:hypothetical protein